MSLRNPFRQLMDLLPSRPLQVGTVTNMYVIAEKMLNAGNVVKP